MSKLKVLELVEDFDLYPRSHVNGVNVTGIAEAIAAGVVLLLIVVCRKTKRIVDGFHRARAYRRLYGADYEIEVEFRDYKNDGEIILDAARLNAPHGQKLAACDQTRCALIAQRLHVPVSEMAKALSISVDKLAKLTVDRSALRGGLHVPIKRTIAHMAGKKLTRAQGEVNEKLSGMNQLFYVNQLVMLIDSNLLDTANETLMERLEELAERLESLRVTA